MAQGAADGAADGATGGTADGLWWGDELPPMYDAQRHPRRDDLEALQPCDDAALAAARRFRDILGRFPSGITVVAGVVDGEAVGLTCQSFSSVSLDPPLVLFVPSRRSRAWPLLRRTGRFAVNLLAADQRWVSAQVAGPGPKFAGVGWTPSPVTGSPLLDGTVGWVDCTTEAVHPGGDHEVVVGRVVDLGTGVDGRPLLYHRGRYETTSDLAPDLAPGPAPEPAPPQG